MLEHLRCGLAADQRVSVEGAFLAEFGFGDLLGKQEALVVVFADQEIGRIEFARLDLLERLREGEFGHVMMLGVLRGDVNS